MRSPRLRIQTGQLRLTQEGTQEGGTAHSSTDLNLRLLMMVLLAIREAFIASHRIASPGDATHRGLDSLCTRDKLKGLPRVLPLRALRSLWLCLTVGQKQ